MKDFGFVHWMTQNRELYAVLKENNNFTFRIQPDMVSGSLPKVKIIHDLRTQGFLAFGNQGDKV